MKPVSRSVVVLSALILVIAILRCAQTAPPGQLVPQTAGTPSDKLPGISFSIADEAAARELITRREIAIEAAIRELTRDGNKERSEDAIVQAARILADLRADDNRAIAALISRLEYTPEVSTTGEPDSLEGLPVARALRRIGGRKVAEALTQSLRSNRTKKEHLIVAHLLIACDGAEVAAFRLERVIESETAAKSPDHDYISQLGAVRYWLDNSTRLRHPDNWPSTM